jgi:hypothetical protein
MARGHSKPKAKKNRSRGRSKVRVITRWYLPTHRPIQGPGIVTASAPQLNQRAPAQIDYRPTAPSPPREQDKPSEQNRPPPVPKGPRPARPDFNAVLISAYVVFNVSPMKAGHRLLVKDWKELFQSKRRVGADDLARRTLELLSPALPGARDVKLDKVMSDTVSAAIDQLLKYLSSLAAFGKGDVQFSGKKLKNCDQALAVVRDILLDESRLVRQGFQGTSLAHVQAFRQQWVRLVQSTDTLATEELKAQAEKSLQSDLTVAGTALLEMLCPTYSPMWADGITSLRGIVKK